MKKLFLEIIVNVCKAVQDELEIRKKSKIKEKLFVCVGGISISLELYHNLKAIMSNEAEKLKYIADINNDTNRRIKYLLHALINCNCELIEKIENLEGIK